MTTHDFNKMTSRYNKIDERVKFEENIKPRLFDIQSWYEMGIDFASIEKQLGLSENELFYMTYLCKIKELKKIFNGEKYNIESAKRSLYRLANGYYVMKEVLVPVTTTKIEGKTKIIETHYEVKRIREYIPKNIKANEFLLSNKLPDEYQVKGQEPKGEAEKAIQNTKNILMQVKKLADDNNKA